MRAQCKIATAAALAVSAWVIVPVGSSDRSTARADIVFDDGAAHTFNDGATHDALGQLIVGSSVSNTSLSIDLTTTVTSTTGVIGSFASSDNNSVVVTNNSVWSNTSASVFDVGRAGDGNTLTISAGASVTNAGDARIGAFSNSNIVTVTGASSQWNISGGFYVADFAGTGNELRVKNGGSASAGITFFGNSQGGNSLSIDTAGKFTVASSLIVGNVGVSTGNSVSVDGSSSKLQVNGAGGATFILGNSGGTNTLTVSNSGLLQTAGDSRVGGNSSNNIATVTGTGSQWTSSGIIFIGDFGGTGNQLHVSDSGSISAAGVFVGNVGGGNSMTVDSGGSVTVSTLTLGSVSSGSSVNISGAGSQVNVTGGAGSFTIGSASGASGNTLTVSDGATLTTHGSPRIGNLGNNNVVTVTGAGSQWNANGDIGISDNSNATGNKLNVEAGGSVSATQVRVGFQPNSTASVKVDGAGSILKSSIAGAVFQVGGPFGTGSGSVTVTNGGTLQFDVILTSPGPSANTIANAGGVYQFTRTNPSITLNTPGDMTLTNGTISYLGVSGADINNAQVAQISRSGNNTFRLNNSTNAAIASYTFDSGNPAIYQKLEVTNGGHWTSTNLTVGNGGAIRGAAASDVVEVTGDFTITRAANPSGDFDLSASQVKFSGGGTHVHLITGVDLGNDGLQGFANGFTAKNFSYGRLSLGSASDIIDFGSGDAAATNALYVKWVDLGNVSLVSNLRAHAGIDIYYFARDPGNAYLNNQVYQLNDWDGSSLGGFLLPAEIPEPASAALLLLGGGTLMASRRRRPAIESTPRSI